MPPELREVKRWLEKAEHDQAGAEAAMERDPPITDVAAFHCQQAAEKLLKGYLVCRRNPFERTYDLVELLALCAKHDSGFAALRPDVEHLTPYAVRFRYPGPADPDAEKVREALATVRRIRAFVIDRLPPEIVSEIDE